MVNDLNATKILENVTLFCKKDIFHNRDVILFSLPIRLIGLSCRHAAQ